MASRIALRGVVDGGPAADAVTARARELGVLGWVRPTGELHAEGDAEAVRALVAFLGAGVAVEPVQGRGPRAVRDPRRERRACSSCRSTQATAHHYDVRLEVDGVMRSWAVPKGPSLDPAAKRLAVQVEDHGLGHNDFEGTLGDGGVIVWDRGTYEQGGRVAWPEALDRGHAVFVLHGEKLRGGFALQRTRGGRQAAVAADQAPRRRGPPRLGHRRRAARVGRERADARRAARP